jgi:exodeoxyribonuclease VII large subunit
VISGVGHEVDFTIADFVADARAPTPSGAAEIAVPDRSEWLSLVGALAQRLSRAAAQQLADAKGLLGGLAHRLARSHPGIQLRESNQRLDDLEVRLRLSWQRLLERRRGRLTTLTAGLRGAAPRRQLAALEERCRWSARELARAMIERLGHRQTRLELAARALQAVSPLATLDRGYAIVSNQADGSVLKDAVSVASGARIEVRLARGELSATVNQSRPDKDHPKPPTEKT